ncbi:MAG: SDR family oxidoreductase [Acidobacteriota bacterium]|nr:SDR family oxidoreductase [Acidobacteriota bacterium]
MPTTTLIAGIGYVGSALAAELKAANHRVYGLRRSAPVDIPGVETIRADLTRPETLEDLPTGINFVVYCASASGRSDEAYRAAYVEGPKNLLAALERQGQAVQRVFFTSSTGVYGQTDGSWLDEESVTEPESFTGQRLLEGEQVFRNGPYPATIVRLSGIYGPGRTRLIDSVRRGEAACQEGPPTYTNRIHRDDCAGVLKFLIEKTLENPEAVQDTYVGVDDDPVDRCVVLRWLAEQSGAPEVPVEARGEEGGRIRGSNKRLSNRRLKELGYRFRFPTFREGYGAMLRESSE